MHGRIPRLTPKQSHADRSTHNIVVQEPSIPSNLRTHSDPQKIYFTRHQNASRTRFNTTFPPASALRHLLRFPAIYGVERGVAAWPNRLRIKTPMLSGSRTCSPTALSSVSSHIGMLLTWSDPSRISTRPIDPCGHGGTKMHCPTRRYHATRM